MKPLHTIQTPRGRVYTYSTKNGITKAKLEFNPGFGPERSRRFNDAQKFVDSECLRLSDPLVPFRSGMMKKSGTLGTVVGSGLLIYVAPYARKQYYGNRGLGIEGTARGGRRGRLFFKRMAAAHGRQILDGAKRRTGAK